MSEVTRSNIDYIYGLASAGIGAQGHHTCFAACLSGLMRSDDGGTSWYSAYGSVIDYASFPANAVVVSPDNSNEQLVVAGCAGGFMRATGDCQSWDRINLPVPLPTVSAMVISPNVGEDGKLFASTLEAGMFMSSNQGLDWESCNFGLVDMNVYSLGISPFFADDETLWAGTSSGIFRTGNAGRAWREIELPINGFETVLAISFSLEYFSTGVIYAGTESSGLFYSKNRGLNWLRLFENLIDGAVSVLCPIKDGLLIVNQGEVKLLRDGGTSCALWQEKALKEVEVTALCYTSGLQSVLVGCAGGSFLRFS